MAKINIKRALNKKTLMLLAGAGAGFYGGQKLSEIGILDQVTSPLGASVAPWANGAIKIVGGALVYTTGKGEFVKGVGVGLGVNGFMDVANEAMINGMPGMSSQTSRNWVNGQDLSLNGQDASLNGGYPDQPN